jgi:hypothetical protein
VAIRFTASVGEMRLAGRSKGGSVPDPGADVAAYVEVPPLSPRQFTRWLASQTGLTFELAEDAVEWLREQSPARFINRSDEVVWSPV